MKFEEFKQWLEHNDKYTPASIKDILSRLRRANRILQFQNEDIYLFKLSQSDEFKQASVSVRSQIRRSVKLYFQYIKEVETE